MNDLEFEQSLCRVMSVTAVLYNKNVSPVIFLLMLLEHEKLRDFTQAYFDMSLFDVIKNMSVIYPVLYKSRKIQRFITTRGIRLPCKSYH